jgi:hypothetical protein
VFCPACNTQNNAMATHCFQCRTQLIFPEQERSPEVKAVVRQMDSRIYGGMGFGVCCVIGYLVFQHAGGAVFLGFVGGGLGRYIASRKARGL